MSKSSHDRFATFYGKGSYATCHGQDKEGDRYVCPKPTIGGFGTSPFVEPRGCTPPAPNMGRLAHCASVPDNNSVGQIGGAALDLMFTATGQLGKKRRSCGCQKGGAHRRCKKTRKLAEFNDTSDPSLKTRSSDIPRSTCGCRSSSCDGKGTPISGYYMDIAAKPIGNGPVHGTHSNMGYSAPVTWNDNLMDRKFDCQQPFWCEKCL